MSYEIILRYHIAVVLVEQNTKILETGIEGLDAALRGGIPRASNVLIEGAPGTGKSLMAFQFLYTCAKKGIPSAFIALDERPDNVLKNVKNTFNQMQDIDELIKKDLITVDGQDSAAKITANTEAESSYSMGTLVSEVEGIIKSIDAKVAVIDSVSFLKLMMGKTILFNKSIASLTWNLRRMDVTSIFTMDVPYFEKSRMKFGQELLFFDGVIALYYFGEKCDDGELALQIIKMRSCDHDRKVHKYGIASSGIKLD